MMRDCQMYSPKVALSKTISNCSNHCFMLKTYRTDTFSSWKYAISNYDCKFRCSIGTKYVRSPCYISKLALSPHKFNASSAVLQMNKDIHKVWRYAVLQWHNVTTKYPEYQWITSRSVVDGKTTMHTLLYGIRVSKIPLPSQKSGWYTEINVQVGNKLPCDSRFANPIF
jgi:hypothetical protein